MLAAWRELSAQGINNRAAAARLGVSEADLVHCACGEFALHLRPEPLALLQAARALGPVKAVARNDHAVLERTGAIRELGEEQDGSIVAACEAFRLRIEPGRVARAFALTEAGRGGPKRSIQLFGLDGISVAKLVLRPDTEPDTAAFAEQMQRLRHPDQGPLHHPAAVAVRAPVAATARQRASAVPGDEPPAHATNPSLAAFLQHAAAIAVPLGLAVRNRGACLEAVSPLRRVKRSERAPWINVLDADLDVHLLETEITRLEMQIGLGDAGRFLWRSRDGSEAFAAGAACAFHELMAAAYSERTAVRL
ncbi:MAG: hypothetical protein IT514_04310 [Burkholderiales bacterium]|nr:hypothetical protein [Burkholderiales bacterium]